MLARCAEDLPAGPLLATIRDIERGKWRVDPDPELAFRHLRITRDAFRPETEREIAQFRTYARDHVQDARVQQLCELACMSVLESVSFTRKDGQYLRWDSRSVRTLSGKPFDKGPILTLETAIVGRLREMAEDVSDSGLFPGSHPEHEPDFLMHEGSCLHVLPSIATDSIDVLVTSPPYCNRYDYTRTYALELAYLGVDEFRLKQLRQSLLSCTVENRSKVDELHSRYGTNGSRRRFQSALRAFEGLDALQEVLILLDAKGRNGELNNPNVPRMVRNYFLESAVAIFEWARVVRPGGRVAVVNDNVQYGGEEVPVDLILCELAERAGFRTEAIWTLERGKGNSSQQMGPTAARSCGSAFTLAQEVT